MPRAIQRVRRECRGTIGLRGSAREAVDPEHRHPRVISGPGVMDNAAIDLDPGVTGHRFVAAIDAEHDGGIRRRCFEYRPE